jgi:hypothetical protein
LARFDLPAISVHQTSFFPFFSKGYPKSLMPALLSRAESRSLWVTDHERCTGVHCSTTLAFCGSVLSFSPTYLLYNRPATPTKTSKPSNA